MNILKLYFSKLVTKLVSWFGSVWACLLSILSMIIWFIIGLYNGFPERYNIIWMTWISWATYIMVFFIQNSQNRESKALHLKIDELIRSKESADNCMINIEMLSDQELDILRQEITKKLTDK